MMSLKIEMSLKVDLSPVRGIVIAVFLLVCIAATVPVAAVGFVGHGGSFSPFLTVLDWLGLTEVVGVIVGESPEERPTFEKEGSSMDPNGVYGAEDDNFVPDWPAAVLGTGGG